MSARRIYAQDDLTIHHIHDLAPELIAAACSGDLLHIDLSAVERIDTSGVQLLAMLQREASRCKTELVFENPSIAVQDMLGFYNLNPLLRGNPKAVQGEPAHE